MKRGHRFQTELREQEHSELPTKEYPIKDRNKRTGYRLRAFGKENAGVFQKSQSNARTI